MKQEEKEQSSEPVSSREEYLRAHTVGELIPLSGPICIVDYDPVWPRRFEREADSIRSVLAERALQVDHVGSTAVPGLPA